MNPKMCFIESSASQGQTNPDLYLDLDQIGLKEIKTKEAKYPFYSDFPTSETVFKDRGF